MGDVTLRYRTLVDLSNLMRLFEIRESEDRSVSSIVKALSVEQFLLKPVDEWVRA